MIPLYISIPCVILFLTIIFHWFLTLDIDWEDAFKGAKEIVIEMITLTCEVVAILSIFQWIVYGVKE